MVAVLRDDSVLQRERMQRRSSDALGEVEAYADLGSGSDEKGHGVTEDRRPCGDRDRIATPESDSPYRA